VPDRIERLIDAATADTLERLRAEFIRLLTTDSPHRDRRCRDFNQAVFMADGRPVWTETTLDMITAKFDRAVRNLGKDQADAHR
jgi:hypothetical protein